MRGVFDMSLQQHLMAGAAVAAVATASPAMAQTRQFNVPAQPASRGIPQFARQAGVQIIASGNVVGNRRTNSVRGNYSVDEGLRILLQGTGLTAGTGGAGGIVTVRASQDAGEADAGSAPAEDESANREIVVTGTNLRGGQVAAPVRIITRDDLTRGGYGSIQEAFQDFPSNLPETGGLGGSTGGTSTSSNENTLQTPAISLRGLGPESTLVLLNSQRRAGAIQGRAVDISAIPVAAIERVEIVTGGSSAIYGSDAVAGVVNFITRRNFDGAQSEIYFQANGHNGGDRLGLSQILGLGGSGSGILVAYDYSQTTPLNIAEIGLTHVAQFGNFISRADIVKNTRQHSVFSSGHLSLTNNLELYGDGLWTHVRRRTGLESRNVNDGSISTSDFDTTTTQFNASVGLRWTASPDWSFDVSGNYGRVNEDGGIEFLFIFPPFTFPFTQVVDDHTSIFNVRGVLNGSIQLGARSIELAAGVEGRHETLDLRGTTGPKVGERDVRSGFLEMRIPILAPNEAGRTPLELTIAGRYDHYSDFGSTFNPQIGLIWRATNNLSVRGVYSRAFRAPDLFYLFGTNSTCCISLNYPDPTINGSRNVIYWDGANPNLGPERADTYSATIEYVSTSNGLRLGASFFNIKYQDRIASPVGNGIINNVLADPALQQLANRNPTAAELDEVLATRSTPLPRPSGGIYSGATLLTDFPNLAIFDARYVNFSSETSQGLDIEANWPMDFAQGRLTVGGDVTYLLKQRRRRTPLVPSFSVLNDVGRPIDLRFRLSAAWERGPFGAFAYFNHTDHYRASTTGARIGAFNTVDLTLRYDSTREHNGFPFSVAFTVGNLFDERPPYYDDPNGGYSYDTANADPIGRTFALRIIKPW